MFGQDHVAVLREDELLHGESVVRSKSRRGDGANDSVDFDWYEESE